MVFLTPATPRWSPKTESDLRAACEGGLLTESHYFDLKASLPPGRSKNRELARDIASFAVDGGSLLIGVGQIDNLKPELVPVELAGLAERVELVARTLPEPPIPVVTAAISSDEDAGSGYLLVEVPATGTAPHMVDGVYMGRGDKTKIRLSDAEVLRLHRERARLEEDGSLHLTRYVDRDPITPTESAQAHGFVVAMPVLPRPEMLLAVRSGASWSELIARIVQEGAYASGSVLEDGATYDPALLYANDFQRRSDGVALTYNLDEQRQPLRWRDDQGPHEDVIELEVTEEGGLRVMTTRLGDALDGTQVVFEDVLPDLVRRTIGMAAVVADMTGYGGPWTLGAAATRLAGKPIFGAGRVLSGSRLGTFTNETDAFQNTIVASAIEVRDIPGVLTSRIVGRMLRSVGVDDSPRLQKFLTDTEAR